METLVIEFEDLSLSLSCGEQGASLNIDGTTSDTIHVSAHHLGRVGP
jgi:hypothetical protein